MGDGRPEDSRPIEELVGDQVDMEVKSELYDERTFQKAASLENSNSVVTLQFVLNDKTTDVVDVDEDGDLVVPRNNRMSVEIEFSKSTVIPLVGLQIWRGAFVLADYILSEHRPLFEDKTVLELAAGVGFTSVVAGMVAKEVVCTDIDKGGILDMIQRNFARNAHLMKASACVLPLDFYQDELSPQLERKLKETEIIIAADVIYDNDLSEAFVKCLTKILRVPPKKTFILALEKRFVFTVEDLDVAAPCYDHFFTSLKSSWSSPPMSAWTIQQLDLDFEQRFEYERTKHLVLWKFAT